MLEFNRGVIGTTTVKRDLLQSIDPVPADQRPGADHLLFCMIAERTEWHLIRDRLAYYRVHLGPDDNGPEIGVAWTESSEKAGEYLSLTIDAPSFPQPVRARLFQNGADATSWSLHWSRPQKRGERK